MNPKFSIAIPAYKKKFLKECIDSVLTQSFKDFELIIVNDASPEDLDSIVALYSDKRLKYYINDYNFGAFNVVDNWNKCLEYACGDFIICMGDDDKLMPNCLEEYVNLINKYPHLDAFHARIIRIDEKSQIIDIMPNCAEYENIFSFMRHRFNRRMQYIGDFCFRTIKLKEKGGYYKLPMAWDSDDITSFLMVAPYGIAHTNKATFMYRVNENTISNIGNNEIKMQAIVKAESWLKEFLKSLKPDTFEEIEEYRMLPALLINSVDIEKTIILFSSFKQSIWSVFCWYMSKDKYSLRNRHILKALLMYMNRKSFAL